MRSGLLAIGLALVCSSTMVRGQQSGTEPSARIGRLIGQLGSDSFLDRDQARRDLETIGVSALPALRLAMQKSDLETARRAAALIGTIERKARTASMLAPRMVHLKLRDTPVLQAVDVLARLSGCIVRVDGDRTPLAGKTVTMDTGKVTFWEALDRLCDAAELAEKATLASIPSEPKAVFGSTYYYAPILDDRRPRRSARMRPLPPPPLRLMPLPPTHAKSAKDTPQVEKPPLPVTPGMVILMLAPRTKVHASHAGAVRLSLTHAKPRTARHYDFVLDASADPRLVGCGPSAVPTIARAIDEHGQALTFVIDPPGLQLPPPKRPGHGLGPIWLNWGMTPNVIAPRGITIRLEAGAKPAKRLKELTGTLPMQVLMMNTTLAAHDLKAVLKSTDLKGAGRLQLQKVAKATAPGGGGDTYTVVYALEGLPNGMIPNVNAIRGEELVPVNGRLTPELLDAKGRRLVLTEGPMATHESGPNGQIVRSIVTVEFCRGAGQGEPVRLLLTGVYVATVVVPFRFVDVPLR